MSSTVPDDTHVFRMTDCTGMLQHAAGSVPDPSEGYATDDNARALIMAALLYEKTEKRKYLDLVFRYLSFLIYAQNGGWFRNFMDYNRNFVEKKGSQDCFGRCVLSLGFLAGRSGLPAGIRGTAGSLLEKCLPRCGELRFPRSKAYAAIGLGLWKKPQAVPLMRKLGAEILDTYSQNSTDGWHWFENSVTYCNAVLPWALLAVCERTGGREYLAAGIESLDFLLKTTFEGELFRPVGCKGWLQKGNAPAAYDQQPVEACGTLLACLAACRLTGEKDYRDCAYACLGWYTGKNARRINMIDPESGGCMDGITPQGANRNEGAESLISWMISSLALPGAD